MTVVVVVVLAGGCCFGNLAWILVLTTLFALVSITSQFSGYGSLGGNPVVIFCGYNKNNFFSSGNASKIASRLSIGLANKASNVLA
jgi:hypothetical protein